MGRGFFLLSVFGVATGIGFIGCISDAPFLPDSGVMDSQVPPMDATVDTGVDSGVDTGVDTGIDTGIDTGVDTGVTCGLLGLNCCANNPQCMGGTACCSSKCIDPQNDPKNCGMCNHDCRGGGCAKGVCQPQLLGQTPDVDPTALVIDNTNAYFGVINKNVGSLFSCPLSGCPDGGPPQQLIGGIKYAGDVAQYGNNIYVTDFNASTVWVWDKQNQSKSQTSFSSPAGIDTDGAGHVFMVENSGPIQVQSDLTNKITLGPTFSGASDITTSGNGYVYWTAFGMNASRVIRWGKTGQANSQTDLVDLGTMMNHQNVAANGSALVYQQSVINTFLWDIVFCPSSPPCNNPSKIASGQTLGIRQGNMILDNSDVYWTTNDSMMHGNVVRCATNGCNNNPAIVGQVPVGNNPQPAGVAVDSTFVYFLMGDNAGTKLYRVVKQ